MIDRNKAVAKALALAETDPPVKGRAIERVEEVFSIDGGLTWIVHLLPESVVLSQGDKIIEFCDTPGTWAVCVCGQTEKAKWVEML